MTESSLSPSDRLKRSRETYENGDSIKAKENGKLDAEGNQAIC